MQTKIVRLHSARRNPASSEIRELCRLVAQQDRVIADLAMELRDIKRSIPPMPFGFDPRDGGEA